MPMRILRSLLAIAGWFGVAAEVARPQPAVGQEYRASDAAPVEWRVYAQRVQELFRVSLAADDDVARDLAATRGKAGKSDMPPSFTVRAWIAGSGQVERLEFKGLEASTASLVRSRLMRADIGASPPAGMLQPLHLRLSLGDKN